MTKLTGEQVLMRIFIGESDRHGHIPLYEALVELLRREGLAGATVIRCIAGFGAHSVYHTDKLLRLSTDLPVIVEVVDSQERIDAVMPVIDGMMDGGMITLEKATVIRYSHHDKNKPDFPPPAAVFLLQVASSRPSAILLMSFSPCSPLWLLIAFPQRISHAVQYEFQS